MSNEKKETRKPDTRTALQKVRAHRQDQQREQLSSKGHITHITRVLNQLDNDDIEMDALTIQRKKIFIDTQLRLLNKYLPDLKNTEITGEAGGDIIIKVAEFKA